MNKFRYFHCYATANDDRFYYRDFQNLLRIRNHYSGVDKLFFFIAISEVNTVNWMDKVFTYFIKLLFSRCSRIDLKGIIFKSNVGRDFSSFALMSDLIQSESKSNDYVLFQNRSGYGPFNNNWFKDMIDQFEKFESVALCGSTINFSDHPNRSNRKDMPHVQTYSFLTRTSFLKMFGTSFPGKDERERLDIITKGEIELSHFFLNKGYGITCIEWPDKLIYGTTEPVENDDIKANVKKNHHFYHRTYFKRDDLKNKYRMLNYLKMIVTILTISRTRDKR